MVVPRHGGDLRRGGEGLPEAFCIWLRELSRRGHSLWMHGLTHVDGKGGEAEFSRLRVMEIRQRLQLGLRDWTAAGLPAPAGFCPPCWKASVVLAMAAAREGFHTVASRWGVRKSGDFGLALAVSSWGGRSLLARLWNRSIPLQVCLLERFRIPWRLALHPQDFDSAAGDHLVRYL